MRTWKAWILGNGSLQRRDRAGEASHREMNDAEIVENGRTARIEPRRTLQCPQGLVVSTSLHEPLGGLNGAVHGQSCTPPIRALGHTLNRSDVASARLVGSSEHRQGKSAKAMEETFSDEPRVRAPER
jgi:hypothetical protein